MTDRMTLTDIAAHIGCSRPSAYIIITMDGFPVRSADDRRWDRSDVMDWLTANTVAVDAVSVGGMVVVRT